MSTETARTIRVGELPRTSTSTFILVLNSEDEVDYPENLHIVLSMS